MRKTETISFKVINETLLNIVLEFLATAIRQEKEKKGIEIGITIPTCNDMNLYLKDPKASNKNLLDLTHTFGKVGHKTDIQKSLSLQGLEAWLKWEALSSNPSTAPCKKKTVAFLYTNNEQADKSGKQSQSQYPQKS
jgi:hypothetical protein